MNKPTQSGDNMLLDPNETEESRLSKLTPAERRAEANQKAEVAQKAENDYLVEQYQLAGATEEALLGSLSLYDTTAFDHILTAHGVTIPEDRVNPIDLEAIDDMVTDLTRVNPLLAKAVHDTVASAWSGVTL